MLILTRKLGERINIGDDIVITLVEVKGAQVKLGVDAPKSIAIHRYEIYERIRKANLESSDVRDADLAGAVALLQNINFEGGDKVED